MRGTIQDGGPDSFKKGCCRSSWAEARWDGSLTNIRSRNAWRTDDTFWKKNTKAQTLVSRKCVKSHYFNSFKMFFVNIISISMNFFFLTGPYRCNTETPATPNKISKTKSKIYSRFNWTFCTYIKESKTEYMSLKNKTECVINMKVK